MTSEQKARAWEMAADLVDARTRWLLANDSATEVSEHARTVVQGQLRAQAKRIRGTLKWRRENRK